MAPAIVSHGCLPVRRRRFGADPAALGSAGEAAASLVAGVEADLGEECTDCCGELGAVAEGSLSSRCTAEERADTGSVTFAAHSSLGAPHSSSARIAR